MFNIQSKHGAWLGLLLVPALGLPLLVGSGAKAREEPLAAKSSEAAAIKPLLQERYDTASRLVELLTTQYRAGSVDMGRVVAAQKDTLSAAREIEVSPAERIATLQKVSDKASDIEKQAELQVRAGLSTQADVLEAKSVMLEARIELLREQLKARGGR